MGRNFRGGELLDTQKFVMWRYFFDAILAVLSECQFCCNICYFVAKPVLSCFTHFLCGKKWSPTILSVEKR